jgi:hypothetical protein
MTQQVEARVLSEVVSAADPGIRRQLDRTSRVVAAADQAHVLTAIGEAGWERRGVLGRLTRPRLRGA